MIYQLGRFLQLLGLLILPAGVAGNLSRPDLIGVRASLAIALIGISVFSLGWLLQQAGRVK
jgi:hypothetical protein